MRLIDADKLAEELSERVWFKREDEKQAVRIVKEFPTVDAVPVVRCRDCKHFVISEGVCALHSNNYEPPVYCGDEDFCSWGRRKARKGGDDD